MPLLALPRAHAGDANNCEFVTYIVTGWGCMPAALRARGPRGDFHTEIGAQYRARQRQPLPRLH